MVVEIAGRIPAMGQTVLFGEACKMCDMLCYDSDVKADVQKFRHVVSAQQVNVKMLGLLQMAVL